jgi:hypothetical protein
MRRSSSSSDGFGTIGIAINGLKLKSVEDESGSGNEQLHAASSRPKAPTTSVVDVSSHSRCLGGTGNNATVTITDGTTPFGHFGGICNSLLLTPPFHGHPLIPIAIGYTEAFEGSNL